MTSPCLQSFFSLFQDTRLNMLLAKSDELVIDFAQAAQAANRILSFRVPQKQDTKATSELQDTEGGVKIELRDLWFKYPTRDVPIFTGLNLTVSNLSTLKLPDADFDM